MLWGQFPERWCSMCTSFVSRRSTGRFLIAGGRCAQIVRMMRSPNSKSHQLSIVFWSGNDNFKLYQETPKQISAGFSPNQWRKSIRSTLPQWNMDGFSTVLRHFFLGQMFPKQISQNFYGNPRISMGNPRNSIEIQKKKQNIFVPRCSIHSNSGTSIWAFSASPEKAQRSAESPGRCSMGHGEIMRIWWFNPHGFTYLVLYT